MSCKVWKMPTLDSWDWLDEVDFSQPQENKPGEGDLFIEEIVENINKTPIGDVLSRIAEMPEVRKEKVLGVRQQLCAGEYDLTGRLDEVLERILQELNQ